MAGALEAFADNMADAERLVAYARALTNRRTYRMRKELRAALGPALKIPKKQEDLLDGLESDDLFVVFKPKASLGRADFSDHAPLLRQALVAACAATETFLADWAVDETRSLIRDKRELPSRMLKVLMSVADWQLVHARKYPRRAITDYVIAPFIREHASTAPNRVGEVLSLVGCDKPLSQIDNLRKVTVGTTEEQLSEITERRNRIAHASDRVGRGRATIEVDEVDEHLSNLRSIVGAIGRLPIRGRTKRASARSSRS
jgi:hypothetical protein